MQERPDKDNQADFFISSVCWDDKEVWCFSQLVCQHFTKKEEEERKNKEKKAWYWS